MSSKRSSIPVGTVERSSGVLLPLDGHVVIGAEFVNGLRRYARCQNSGRARLLLHGDETNPLHEMVIAARPFTLWPPHRHDGDGQSWTAVHGTIAYVEFEGSNEISDIIILDPRKRFHLRQVKRKWYTIVPLTDMSVYLETRLGRPHGSIFSDWGFETWDHPLGEKLQTSLSALGYNRPED